MEPVEFLPIAIVGLAGRFPGAGSIAEFWQALAEGRRLIRDFSVEELEAAGVPVGELANPRYVRSYGWLAGALQFDAAHFGMSPAEAALIDPQHRLFLECAVEALADAGPQASPLAERTAIFAGCLPSAYLRCIEHSSLAKSFTQLPLELGNQPDFLASRVAWHLGLHGPAVNVNAACATSLFAMHAACSALQRGECDLALAGAVSVRHFFPAGYLAGGVLSPDGHCRPFDQSGAGTVFGDGAGCLVLRRADEARASGQQVYGVIAASATGNDGAGRPSFAAPSAAGQSRVLAQACRGAGLEAGSAMAYVEAHGTGTLLGDELELAAMRSVFELPGRAHPLAIGSVKGNCGHLDAAAGLAGLVKVLGAFASGRMPPTVGVIAPRPDLHAGGLRLCQTAEPAPRMAGVSSFGMGGHSAHMILLHPGEHGRSRPPTSRVWQRKLCSLPGLFDREERGGWANRLQLSVPGWERIEELPADSSPACTLLVHEAGICRRLAAEGRNIEPLVCPEPPGPAALDPAAWREIFKAALARGGSRLLVDGGALQLMAPGPETGVHRTLARQVGLLQAMMECRLAAFLSLTLDARQGDPVHAAVAALNLVARQEHPSWPIATVEMACAPEQVLPAILARSAAILRSESHLRVEEDGWFRRRFEVPPPTAGPPVALTPESVCVVIGGTGQIGSAVAAMLATSFGCQVIATGRTESSVARDAALQNGARHLQFRRLQVEDAEEVKSLLASVARRFGRLDLVIHSASCPGEECFQCLGTVTVESLRRVLTPKAAGTATLLSALAAYPAAKLVALSSLAAELGGLSLGPYAAACRYQDALIDFHREQRHVPWLSVNLDHWELPAASAEALQQPETVGVPRIEEAAGLALFRHLFSRWPPGRLLVARTSLPERAQRWTRPAPAPMAPAQDETKDPGDMIAQTVAEYCAPGAFRADRSLAEMGIDSLAAMDLAAALHAKAGWDISAAELYAARNLDYLRRAHSTRSGQPPVVTVLRSGERGGALVLIHPHGGGIGAYQALVQSLEFEGSILGVRAQGLFGEAEPLGSVEKMAARYLQDLAAEGVVAPVLLGYSAGGLIAFEMARRLARDGAPARALILLDTLPPAGLREAMQGETMDETAFLSEVFLGSIQLPEEELRRLSKEEAQRAAIALWREAGLVRPHFSPADLAPWRAIFLGGLAAYTTWDIPSHHLPDCLLVRAARQTSGYLAPQADLGWSELAGPDLRVHAVAGAHHEMLRPPLVAQVARLLAQFLRALPSPAPTPTP